MDAEGECQILTSLNRNDVLTLVTAKRTEEVWQEFFADGKLTLKGENPGRTPGAEDASSER